MAKRTRTAKHRDGRPPSPRAPRSTPARRKASKADLPPRPAARQSLAEGDAEAVFHTSEENRGGPFVAKMRMWRMLHEDGGRTIFNKTLLAERFFGDDLTAALASATDDPDPSETDLSDGAPATNGQQRVLERFRKSAQRIIDALQKMGLPIEHIDPDGKSIDDAQLRKLLSKHPFAERRWRYDPSGEWAGELDTLLDKHGVEGFELVGMLACEELVKGLRGTPIQEGVQKLVDRIRRCVPKKLYDDAREQSRVWRYGLSNPAKYIAKKDLLSRWYQATVQRRQVVVTHETPGKPATDRRLAALGTKFDREEDSVYLLGSEPDESRPGLWKRPVQWKLDRIHDVRVLTEKNPTLAAIEAHPLIAAEAGTFGAHARLDIERLYCDSVGAYFSYDKPLIRLEVLIHEPRWMAWCREKPFHPRQRTVRENGADGRPCLRLVVERCYEEEVLLRLMRLGDAFTVVHPTTLVERLVTTANTIASRHAAGRG